MRIESSNSIIEVTIINQKKNEKWKNEMNEHPYPMTLESRVFKCMNNGI